MKIQSLSSWPTELIYRVIEELEDARDVLNLAITNKYLSTVCIPELYKEINISCNGIEVGAEISEKTLAPACMGDGTLLSSHSCTLKSEERITKLKIALDLIIPRMGWIKRINLIACRDFVNAIGSLEFEGKLLTELSKYSIDVHISGMYIDLIGFTKYLEMFIRIPNICRPHLHLSTIMEVEVYEIVKSGYSELVESLEMTCNEDFLGDMVEPMKQFRNLRQLQIKPNFEDSLPALFFSDHDFFDENVQKFIKVINSLPLNILKCDGSNMIFKNKLETTNIESLYVRTFSRFRQFNVKFNNLKTLYLDFKGSSIEHRCILQKFDLQHLQRLSLISTCSSFSPLLILMLLKSNNLKSLLLDLTDTSVITFGIVNSSSLKSMTIIDQNSLLREKDLSVLATLPNLERFHYYGNTCSIELYGFLTLVKSSLSIRQILITTWNSFSSCFNFTDNFNRIEYAYADTSDFSKKDRNIIFKDVDVKMKKDGILKPCKRAYNVKRFIDDLESPFLEQRTFQIDINLARDPNSGM